MTLEKTKANWCNICRTPILSREKGSTCPLCQGKTRYLCADIRPVFPEERLLLELLLGQPMDFHGKSVWASKRGFYMDGEFVRVQSNVYAQADPNAIRQELLRLETQNSTEWRFVQGRGLAAAGGVR